MTIMHGKIVSSYVYYKNMSEASAKFCLSTLSIIIVSIKAMKDAFFAPTTVVSNCTQKKKLTGKKYL